MAEDVLVNVVLFIVGSECSRGSVGEYCLVTDME